MLKLNLKPTFTETVELTVPGKKIPARVKLTFKYRTRSQYLEWNDALKGKEDDEVLMGVIEGWQGFDEDFSREAVETLIDAYPASSQEIIAAYHSLLLGSRAKN